MTMQHPSAEELMAYGDATASAEVVAFGSATAGADVVVHVQSCSTCGEDVARYLQTQGELRAALFRFDCPDAHALGDYYLDLVEPAARARIAVHVGACDHCLADLQTVRAFLSAPPRDP
jgi:hypothetical protein